MRRAAAFTDCYLTGSMLRYKDKRLKTGGVDLERPGRFIRNLRIKHKLFVSYLFVIIIPLSVLGWYSYDQSRNLLVQQARLTLTDNVSEIAANLDYKFGKLNAALDSFTFNSSVVSVFNNDYSDNYYYMYNDLNTIVEPLFNTLLFLNEEIRQLTVYTGNNITERKNTILPISSVSGKPWYEAAMASGQTHWIKEGTALSAVRRMVGGSGTQYDNLIYLGFDSQEIFAGLTNVVSGEYGVLVENGAGEPVYDYHNGLPSFESAKAAEERASDFIVISQTLGVTGWKLVFYMPKNSIGVDAKTILRATMLTVGICLLILVPTVWLLSNAFVRRIYRLNRTMKRVTRGDLHVDIVVDSNDEIGELTSRFKDMLQSLNELFNEVYRSKVVQKDAELKALQAQINPHFLYNSLSLINWKAISIKAYDISKITTTLSKFYRTTLNRGQDVISVQDELENTKSYIDLQLIMHDHSFDVVYEVDPEVLGYHMIKLIMQPIVENAIEHGVDNKREGRGRISLRACFEEDTIVFSIEDNGPGMTQETMDTVLSRQSKSYGLFNAQERIRIYFGEAYGIMIHSEIGQGTTVVVRIPKRTT